MGCDTCCPEPPCPAPSLECQQISQTKSKAALCGFVNPADGLYYSTKATRTQRDYSHTYSNPGGYQQECHSDVTKTEVKSIVGDTCPTSTTWSGTLTASDTPTDELNPNSASGASGTMNSDGSWTGTKWWMSAGERVDGTLTGGCVVGTDTVTITYSGLVSPETTADLISRTIAALPAWPETWTGGCSSFRNLSPDESSFSLTRTKWRVAHSPTGTCYLKVWLRTRFVPEGGGSEIITPLTAYEWTATGNPCIPDLTKGPDHADNIIRSDETEEQEPADDGTTYVEIVKWSCQSGYTPPDDGSANGLPPFAP